MERQDPAVKTEFKIEVDVAEEPPQPWFMVQDCLPVEQLNFKKMADKEPVGGPSRVKKMCTQPEPGQSATTDAAEVLSITEDSTFEDSLTENMSDDSLDDNELEVSDSIANGSAEVDIARQAQYYADPAERAEMEAEYDSDTVDYSCNFPVVSKVTQHLSDGEQDPELTGTDVAVLTPLSNSRLGMQQGGEQVRECERGRGGMQGVKGVSKLASAQRRGSGQHGGRGVLDHPLEPPNWTEPEIPQFKGQPGLKVPVEGTSPLAYFRLFLTSSLLENLIKETNRYATQALAASQPLQQFAGINKWKEVDCQEMEKFLGLVLLTGIVNKPTSESYWSTIPVLYTPIFPEITSRNRFQLMLRFFHCSDNSQEPTHDAPNRDSLYKLRPLVTYLQERFQSVYTPDKYVALDESLLLWKGQLVSKQFISFKRPRYGIKLFTLCEDSGYTCRFQIYTGDRDSAFPMLQHVPDDAAHLTTAENIAIFMTDGLLDQGYHVFMDKRYSSIGLYQYMRRRNTVCCGTVRESQVPLPVTELQVTAENPMQALRSGPLLFIKWWHSSKVVYMLTTMHDESMQQVVQRGGKTLNKPSAVVSYNSKMEASGRADQMLLPYDASRKIARWYKKLMIRLLQVSLFNAYIVFKKSTQSCLDFVAFQGEVITELIFQDSPAPKAALPDTKDEARLTGRHFPRRLPQPKGHNKSRRCRVCYKHGIRKETSFMCELCPSQPPLCIVPCFEVYHTVRNY